MNSLVTALPGLEPIFISADGVNALAGVLFYITLRERLVPNIALLNDVFLIEQWRLILYLNFKT